MRTVLCAALALLTLVLCVAGCDGEEQASPGQADLVRVEPEGITAIERSRSGRLGTAAGDR